MPQSDNEIGRAQTYPGYNTGMDFRVLRMCNLGYPRRKAMREADPIK